MTGWLVIGVLGVVAVLAVALVAPDWVYHWRHAAHVIEVTEAEPVAAPEYGSMILAEEKRYDRYIPGFYPAAVPLEDPGGWTDDLLGTLHEPGRRPRGMTEPLDLEPGAGLILSPGYNSHLPSGEGPMKVDSPAPDDPPPASKSPLLPAAASTTRLHTHDDGALREVAEAGVESEPFGVTVPPAPERLCESGCGCRYGTEDPDCRDCTCDGPCCMAEHEEWYGPERLCSTEQVTWRDDDPLGPPDCGDEVRAKNRAALLETRLLRTTGEIARADLLADVCADIARRDAETEVWLVEFRQRWAAA